MKKEDIGFAAELKVYNELCDKYGKENVRWVSTNAERIGVLAAGQGNDNLHYDIDYFNENGVKRFVEVKGSSESSYITFKMSKGEFDFGNNHDNINYYDIHLVIMDKFFNITKYHILNSFFNLRNDGRRKYELLNDTYTLLAKIEEKIA